MKVIKNHIFQRLPQIELIAPEKKNISHKLSKITYTIDHHLKTVELKSMA